MAKKFKFVDDPEAYKKKKKKPSKMSKSSAAEKVYQSFNTLDYTTMTPEDFIKSLYINAALVLIEHRMPAKYWCTFVNLEYQVKKTWDAKDFIRFWLDRAVEEFGHMIWNEVYKKYWNEEWYQRGVLHDAPDLPKKLRANPEAVAGHFADFAVTKYKEHYK